jgi:D-alanine transaminase
MAQRIGIPFRAVNVSEGELRSADEIWLAAATREVQSVTRLDRKPVGAGVPGPLWRRVYDAYQREKRAG